VDAELAGAMSTNAPARLRIVSSSDVQEFTPSARLSRLQTAKRAAYQALEAALIEEGVARPSGEGHTPIQRRLRAYEIAAMRVEAHFENRIAKLCRQLENVLATDTFNDPDARAAVIDTIRAYAQKSARNVNDPRLYSRTEHDLIACYRRLERDDRTMVRRLLQRFGTPLTTETDGRE
jgi:hypothetical protein